MGNVARVNYIRNLRLGTLKVDLYMAKCDDRLNVVLIFVSI